MNNEFISRLIEPFKGMSEEAKFGLLSLFALSIFIELAIVLNLNQSIALGTVFGVMIALAIWSTTINPEGHVNENKPGREEASKEQV